MQHAVTSCLQTLDKHFFLVSQLDRCLSVNGDWWRIDVYHLLLICHVYVEIKRTFSASECVFNIRVSVWCVNGYFKEVSVLKVTLYHNLLEQFCNLFNIWRDV